MFANSTNSVHLVVTFRFASKIAGKVLRSDVKSLLTRLARSKATSLWLSNPYASKTICLLPTHVIKIAQQKVELIFIRVRREGFGHSHGYFVSFHSQNISFARPRLAGPEGPRLRLSNPSRRYQIQQNSSCRLSFGIWCAGKDLNLRRTMSDRFTVCCN